MSSSDELKARRAHLASLLHASNDAEEILAFQLELVAQIKGCEDELSRGHKDETANHLHLLRIFGDALAWKFLHPHTIRQLAKNQGRAPSLSSQADGFELTLAVAKKLAESGAPALISDLTHCLRISDVVVAVDPEAPGLIECKKSGGGPPEQLRGRARRQYSRMKGTLDYLKAGRAKLYGEPDERVVVTVKTEPEYNWPVVQDVCSKAIKEGLGSRIVSPHELIFALREDAEFQVPLELTDGVFNAKGAIIGVHLRPIDEAWSTVSPPLAWPLPQDIQLHLLEGDISLIHLFNPQGLVGFSDNAARIAEVDNRVQAGDHAYAVEVGDQVALLSSNFTAQVLYGYRRVENIAQEMLEFAARSIKLTQAPATDA